MSVNEKVTENKKLFLEKMKMTLFYLKKIKSVLIRIITKNLLFFVTLCLEVEVKHSENIIPTLIFGGEV